MRVCVHTLFIALYYCIIILLLYYLHYIISEISLVTKRVSFTYIYDCNFSLQSPFGNFGEFLSSPYPDATDAGSLPEDLDPFLGNPQGVPTVDDSVQTQSVHHQQPSQPPPPPPPLPEDIQADSLRYAHFLL